MCDVNPRRLERATRFGADRCIDRQPDPDEFRQRLLRDGKDELFDVVLELSGSPDEAVEFEKHPYAADAVRLRRWDDAAKDPFQSTPPISRFAHYLQTAALRKFTA